MVEFKKQTAKLQGRYAVEIHKKFPPLLLELREDEKTGGKWDGHEVTGRFYYEPLGCRTNEYVNFSARMSMSETKVYSACWAKEIMFEYELGDAISGSVPTRLLIDYSLVLRPKMNPAGRRLAHGRLIVENNCITNNKMVHVRDTLWSQDVKFKRVSASKPCIDGRRGVVYLKLTMARAVLAFNPLRPEGLLDAIEQWCKKNEEWIETHWFFSKASRLMK